MTNFIKKNIFDKIRNINIFNSINSHEHHNIPEPILINSDQSDEDGDGGDGGSGDGGGGDGGSGGGGDIKNINNELYESLVLNTRAIGLIYKYLLQFIIFNPQYRKLCKCCITSTEKSILCDYNYNIKVDTITNNTLKLNFLINKFLDIIGEFKCSCNYKKCSFYTHKFYNYYKIYKLYNNIIPVLISYLTSNNTPNLDINISNEINKNVACIHNDIIKYKNYSYCRHVNVIMNNDDVNKNSDLISKIIIINEWLVENNKIVISLFNKQSYDYVCLNIERWNDRATIDRTMNNKAIIDRTTNNKATIDKEINKVYNIDFKLIDIDNRLIRVVLINNNLNYETKREFIELITIKTLDKYDLETVVLKLCEYVIEILNHKYYELGLYVLNNITILYKNAFNMIEHVLSVIINSIEIDITLQVGYIKLIYKLYDNTTNRGHISDIINKLVSISRGDIIINYFKNNYNFLVHCDDYNDKKYIIKMVKKCIIYKKHILLDYILSLINKINKINKIIF